MRGDASDEALVRRALAGSDGAWTKLVGRYERRVYNYALRMIGHPDDALDLMQEVFVGVLRNLPGYRGDGAFAAWLFRIAAYRCTDHLRSRRIAVSLDEMGWDGADGGAVDTALPTDANQLIAKAMAALPTEQRHVVELKFFQEFTFDDIAGQLGISPNTAKTRLYGALRKLRQHEELKDAL